MKRDHKQQELYFLASTAFENKDYRAAEMYYARLIELDPTEHSYHSQFSFALRLQGKLDKALSSIDKAISLNPQDVNLYWMRAAAMKSFSCREKALSVAERRTVFAMSIPYEEASLTLDPVCEEAWLDLIESRLCILDFDGAIGELGRSNKYIQRLRLIWSFLGCLAFILSGTRVDDELDAVFFDPDARYTAWCLIETECLLNDLEKEGFFPDRLLLANMYLAHFIGRKSKGGILIRLNGTNG